MEINQTDKRIAKLWNQGNHSLESIAKKIGRPKDIKRVLRGLVREGLWKVLEKEEGTNEV